MRHIPLLLMLAACDFFPKHQIVRDSGIQDIAQMAHCEYTGTPIVFDEVDPILGFSPLNFSYRGEGEVSVIMVWDDGGLSGELSVGLSLDHDRVSRMEGTWVEPSWDGDSAEFADSAAPQDCPPYLGAEGVLTLRSGDGQLDESLPVSVVIPSELEGRAVVNMDYGDLRGTYAPTQLNPAEWDEITLYIDQSFGDSNSGTLTLMASRVEAGEDGVAEATQIQVAHWPAP